MLNKTFHTGRICNDIELKQTPSGTPVTSFRIACDRDFKNSNGEREADFISVVAWRSTAEFIAKSFSRGRLITVVGSLQMREYTDKAGNKRTAAEIIAETVYFSDSRPQQQQTPAVTDDFSELDDSDGDLPF